MVYVEEHQESAEHPSSIGVLSSLQRIFSGDVLRERDVISSQDSHRQQPPSITISNTLRIFPYLLEDLMLVYSSFIIPMLPKRYLRIANL